MITRMTCPLCQQPDVAIVENVDVDTHGQGEPLGTYAQLASHTRTVTDDSGRAWDVRCPQSDAASSTPMLKRRDG
jgi:hypothetical protein